MVIDASPLKAGCGRIVQTTKWSEKDAAIKYKGSCLATCEKGKNQKQLCGWIAMALGMVRIGGTHGIPEVCYTRLDHINLILP